MYCVTFSHPGYDVEEVIVLYETEEEAYKWMDKNARPEFDYNVKQLTHGYEIQYPDHPYWGMIVVSSEDAAKLLEEDDEIIITRKRLDEITLENELPF